jgi:ketosteroid isomerase-like protein
MKHLITAITYLICMKIFIGCCNTNEAKTISPDDAKQAVLAAHEMRRVATVNENISVLDSLMMDDLTFMHPNAVVDTKPQFLNSISSGAVQFIALTDEDVTVRVHGTTGVVSGVVRVQVIASGTPVDIRVRFTELWVKEGDRWRMLLWQATAV